MTMSAREHLIDIHAREKAGLPDGWRADIWEHVGPPEAPYPFLRLTGAVYPPVTRGPRKGRPNWKKPEAGTERVVTILPDEHEAWAIAWEGKTGRCRACMGEGRRVWGVSVKDGTTYKSCRMCGGSGVPAAIADATKLVVGGTEGGAR